MRTFQASKRPAGNSFVLPDGGKKFQELWVRPTKTSILGTSFWQILHSTNVFVLENKIQDRSLFLLKISYVSNAMDQRSRVGKFGGWFLISPFNRETPFPDFELLDATIASALNEIIQNSYVKKRVSLEELKAQKTRPIRGRQIAYLIYDCFRVTGVNYSVENYADLFAVALRNDDIQEFGTRWNEILLSMKQFPPDDIF